MKVDFSLTKDDFLQNQLYMVSKRLSIKGLRVRSIVYAVAFGIILLVGMYNYNRTIEIFDIVFSVIMSVAMFFIYPLYLQILHKNHYSKFNDKYLKNKIGVGCSLEISGKTIIVKDPQSELKFETSAIREIVEIKSHYFIVQDDVSSLILPKSKEADIFIDFIASNYGVKLIKELDWKWNIARSILKLTAVK